MRFFPLLLVVDVAVAVAGDFSAAAAAAQALDLVALVLRTAEGGDSG